MVQRSAIKVNGLAEMGRILRSFEGKDSIRIQRAAIKKGAVPLEQAMKQNVPYSTTDVDGYHLRDAVRTMIAPRRVRKRMGTPIVYWTGPARKVVQDDPNGYTIAGGLSTNKKAPNYAHIIEDEKPFARPAIDATANEVVSITARELGRGIERQFKRNKKKAAAR